MQNVEVIVLEHGRGLPLPSFQTSGSSGVDLFAAVLNPESIGPGQRALIPTGLCVACPAGHEFQIRPRSGLALRHGVTCLNTPGTVDEDYRGEIKVILANLGNEPFEVIRGMRIAQMVLCPVRRFEWREVSALDETDRGEGGFGHTGHQATEN